LFPIILRLHTISAKEKRGQLNLAEAEEDREHFRVVFWVLLCMEKKPEPPACVAKKQVSVEEVESGTVGRAA
jgi:hypothetical protein